MPNIRHSIVRVVLASLLLLIGGCDSFFDVGCSDFPSIPDPNLLSSLTIGQFSATEEGTTTSEAREIVGHATFEAFSEISPDRPDPRVELTGEPEGLLIFRFESKEDISVGEVVPLEAGYLRSDGGTSWNARVGSVNLITVNEAEISGVFAFYAERGSSTFPVAGIQLDGIFGAGR